MRRSSITPGERTRKWNAFGLAALLVLTIACTQPHDSEVHEDPGVSETPERIVSMTPALTEILFALDLGDRVVGVTTFCDFPTEARDREKIGGYSNPSVEAILALEPDLVVVSPATGNREAAYAVRRAGVSLEVVPAETLEETFAAIEQVARVCGVEDRGADLARRIRERIERVAARTRGLRPANILFCLQLNPLIVAGRGTLPAELVELAGGAIVVDADRYPKIGIETVLDRDPDVILQARMDKPDKPEPDSDEVALEFWNRWPSIAAVRNGRVHVIDGTTALRPGPRIAEAVESLARLIHPEAFADVPISAGNPGSSKDPT